MRRITLIYCLVFLAVLIGASASIPTPLWGAGAWSSVSFTAGLVLSLALLAIASKKVSSMVLGPLPDGATLPRAAGIISMIVLLALLWVLRSGHTLLGGLHDVVSRTAEGVWTSPAAPLGTAVTQAVFKAINALFFIRPSTSVSIVSVALAIPFIFISRSLAISIIGRDDISATDWIPATALIGLGGYSIVFFGGSSTLAAAVMLATLFLATSLAYMRGKVPFCLPIYIFLLAVSTHFSNIFLLPGAACILIKGWKGEKTRNRAAAMTVVVILLAAAGDYLLSLAGSIPRPSVVMISVVRDSLSSLISRPPGFTFSDWGNVLLVLGPVAVYSFVLLFTAGRSAGTEDKKAGLRSFLLINTLAAVVFILLASPLVRRGMRWEVFASTGPVFAAFALALSKGRAASERDMTLGLLPVVFLSILHLTSLTGINASRAMGIDRLQKLPLAAGEAEKLVGMDYLASEDFEEAAHWLGLSTEQTTDDSETWFALGTADVKNEDIVDAISHYNRAVKLSPDRPEYRKELAEAYLEKRWFEEAIEELERLVADNPAVTPYRIRLGYAYNHGGLFDKAVEIYEDVMRSDPGNMEYRRNLASAVLNLGASYHQDEDYERAEKAYRKVMGLLPTSWVAKNNLAMIYMDQNDFEEAYRILDEALKSNRVAARLHYNMALVQEKRGNFQEAFDHLTRSVELSPGVPAPEEVMRRVWNKLQEQKEEAGE